MALNVIFGTGPVGLHTAKALLEKGETVRLVNRSGSLDAGRLGVLDPFGPEQFELVACQAMDSEDVKKAASGARRIFHCVNPLYYQWKDILPVVQQNMVNAALSENAVLAVSENLYSYKRGVEIIHDGTEIDPPTRKGAIRQTLHEELKKAGQERGLQWVSIRASDFYGPGCTGQSMFGTELFLDPLYDGKAAMTIGSLDVPHTFTYVNDFGRALALAAESPEAYGRSWIVPSSFQGSAGDLFERFMQISGKHSRIRRIGGVLLKIIGLFDPVMREMPEMLYQKTEPYVVDGSEFARAFAFSPSDRDQSITETLDWYARSKN